MTNIEHNTRVYCFQASNEQHSTQLQVGLKNNQLWHPADGRWSTCPNGALVQHTHYMYTCCARPQTGTNRVHIPVSCIINAHMPMYIASASNADLICTIVLDTTHMLISWYDASRTVQIQFNRLFQYLFIPHCVYTELYNNRTLDYTCVLARHVPVTCPSQIITCPSRMMDPYVPVTFFTCEVPKTQLIF